MERNTDTLTTRRIELLSEKIFSWRRGW